jgi:hypothetical protein
VPDEPKGKLLWDVVSLRLAAQSANQVSLVGRAKDLLGFTTIVATITGVILNDKLFPVVKGEAPLLWTILAASSLIVVYGTGLRALWPSDYSFAPDGQDFQHVEQTYPSATVDALYRSLAEGYLFAPPDGVPQLKRNQDKLKRLERLVRIETGGIVALGILAFWLAFIIDVKPSSG